MRNFEVWLKEVAERLMEHYGFTAAQAKEYVTDQPECWRPYFDDDYTPAQAVHEDAVAGAD